MSKTNTFQFDELIVLPSNQNSKTIFPAQLSFDKKHIYAGTSGNWRLSFNDLSAVNKQIIERDEYSRNRRGSVTSEILILELIGRGRGVISFKCSTQRGPGITAKRMAQLESFLEGLKHAHRRAKLKNNEKDPYVEEEKASNKIRRSGSGNVCASSSGSHSRTVVTPARSSLYLSPQKKKRSHAFLSPPQRRSEGGSHDNRGSPYRSPSTFDVRRRASEEVVTGNVVQDVAGLEASPARMKLDLPSKSPWNATPTKLRRESEEERSYSRAQRSGIRGGHIKLRKKIEMKMLDFGDESEDEEDSGKKQKHNEEARDNHEGNGDQERTDEKVNSTDDDLQGQVNGKGQGKEVPKRRRLHKARDSKAEKENYDSDVDFDDQVTSNDSSCKKQLRLSIEDEVDDDNEKSPEEEDQDVNYAEPKASNRNTSPSPTPKVTDDNSKDSFKNPSKAVTDDEEGNIESPITTPSDESTTLRTNLPPELTDMSNQTATDPTTVQPKKSSATIHSFFAPRTKTLLSKDTKRTSSTADTYGAILSSPRKEARTDNKASPLTPSRACNHSPPALEAPTPVPKQKQARYFTKSYDDEHNSSKRGASLSLNRPDYFNEEDAAIPGCDPRNSSIYAGDNSARDIAKPRPLSLYRGRQIYGSRPGSGLPRLGHSRLSARRNNSPAQRLDFGLDGENLNSNLSHPTSPSALAAKRGLNFVPIKSNSLDLLSTADHTPGRLDGSPALVCDDHYDQARTITEEVSSLSPPSNIPGIQNLGNTCYLSASLQMLFSLPQFIKDIYKSWESQSPTKIMPLTRALLELAMVVGVLPESDHPMISPDLARSKLLATTAANPSLLKKQMDILTDKFAGYEQRDAHEFLSDLVDFLHDELMAPTSNDPKQVGTKEDKPDAANVGCDTEENDLVDNVSANEITGPTEKDQKVGEVKYTYVNAEAASSKREPYVIPTDDYFHLNVRVCLVCDSCGYSR